MRLCVTFTGGYDSAYVLYKLLSETIHDITVVTFVNDKDLSNHKQIKTTWGRKGNFTSKMDLLLNELRTIRDFEYYEHKVRASDFNSEILDRYSNSKLNGYGPWNYMAWFAENHEGIYDRIVCGITWEQLQNGIGGYYPKTDSQGNIIVEDRIQQLNSWLLERNNKIQISAPLLYHELHQNFTRWHVFKYLPERFQQYCVSCHRPTPEGNPCNNCYKCLWNVTVKHMIEHAEFSAEDLENYRRKKSIEYGGGNNLTAPLRAWLPVEMKRPSMYWGYTYNNEVHIIDSKEKVHEFARRLHEKNE